MYVMSKVLHLFMILINEAFLIVILDGIESPKMAPINYVLRYSHLSVVFSHSKSRVICGSC